MFARSSCPIQGQLTPVIMRSMPRFPALLRAILRRELEGRRSSIAEETGSQMQGEMRVTSQLAGVRRLVLAGPGQYPAHLRGPALPVGGSNREVVR